MTAADEKVRDVLRQIRKFAPDEDWADVIEAAMARDRTHHDPRTGPCPKCGYEITTDSLPWKETEPCPTCGRMIAFYPHVKRRIQLREAFVEAAKAYCSAPDEASSAWWPLESAYRAMLAAEARK